MKVTSYGRYAQEPVTGYRRVAGTSGGVVLFGPGHRHLETTRVIPARTGEAWGFAFELLDLPGERPCKYRSEMLHPPLRQPDGTILTKSVVEALLEPGADRKLSEIWQFLKGYEYELVPGQWTRKVFVDGAELVSMSFEVVREARDEDGRPEGAAAGEIRRFQADPPMAFVVAFSSDGERVLSGDERLVRLWDFATGRELGRFEGHTGFLRHVQFSIDGKRILSASEDGTVRLWDAPAGKELRCFRGHEGPVFTAVLSPDGSRILSSGLDKTLRLWDARTGAEVRRLSGHRDCAPGIAFSPDGRRVLTGGWDRTVRLWEAEGWLELQSFRGHTDNIACVAFSPGGSRIVSTSRDRTALLWDVATGREAHRLVGHEGSVLCAAFLPDGRHLLTGSFDRTLRLWDTASGKEVHRFDVLRRSDAAEDGIRSIAVAPDGRHAVTGSLQCRLQAWRLPEAAAASRPEAPGVSGDRPETLPGETPSPPAESTDLSGVLVAAEDGASALLLDGKWTRVAARRRAPSRMLWVHLDSKRRCWIVGEGGVAWFNGRESRSYGAEEGVPGEPISQVYEDRKGRIWVSSWGDGIAFLAGERWRKLAVEDGLCFHDVNGFAEDGQGRLWVGTDQGVSILAGEQFLRNPMAGQLASLNVKSIAGDSAGRIFLGTTTGLLVIQPDLSLTRLHPGNGLPQKTPQALFIDGRKRVWAGTWGGGVVQVDAAGGGVAKSGALPSAGQVGRICEGAGGAILVASLDSGLWRLGGAAWEHVETPSWLSHLRVVAAIPAAVARQLMEE